MRYRMIPITLASVLLFNCAGKSINIEDDSLKNFNKAMKYFDSEKFIRAKDEFEYIIMMDPGTKLANESQYYKAESLFRIKEFDEAWIAFDRYIRFSNNIQKIEKCRYRVCECAINSSNAYQRDQKQTIRALEQLQMFIEDFPESNLVKNAEESMTQLRNKLAKKDYEVGRLYLKLEEYESAFIYFRLVLNKFYDTTFADQARIGIIFTHILNKNHRGAKNYLNAEKNNFLDLDNFYEAELLISETKEGLSFNHYYQLYK